MHLLHCCPVPSAEFASLSLLINDSSVAGGDDVQSSSSPVAAVGESMTVASPLSTTSARVAAEGVAELHSYLHSVLDSHFTNKELEPRLNKKTAPNKKIIGDPPDYTGGTKEVGMIDGRMTRLPSHQSRRGGSTANQVLLDDGDVLEGTAIQVYRPSGGHGVGLQYLVLRDPRVVGSMASLLLPTSPSSSSVSSTTLSPKLTSSSRGGSSSQSKSARGSNKGGSSPATASYSALASAGVSSLNSAMDYVSAAVLAVGVSGMSYAAGSSPLAHTLPQRIHDCVSILTNLGASAASSQTTAVEEECKRSARLVLSSLLLTDDEERKTNAAIDEEGGAGSAPSLADGFAETKSRLSVMTPIGAVTKSGFGTKRLIFSMDKKKRGMSSMRAVMGQGSPFDSSKTASSNTSADLLRISSERMAILSVAENDMALRRYEERERRKQDHSGGGKNLLKPRVFGFFNRTPTRPRRLRGRSTASSVSSDLAGFDYVAPPRSPSALSAAGGHGGSIHSLHSTVSSVLGSGKVSSSSVVIPTLMRPRNDIATIGKSRRQSQQQQNTKRWLVMTPGGGRDARQNRTPPPQPQQQQQLATNSFEISQTGWDVGSSQFSFDGFGDAATPSNSSLQNGEPVQATEQKKTASIQRRDLDSHFQRPSPRFAVAEEEEDLKSVDDASVRSGKTVDSQGRRRRRSLGEKLQQKSSGFSLSHEQNTASPMKPQQSVSSNLTTGTESLAWSHGNFDPFADENGDDASEVKKVSVGDDASEVKKVSVGDDASEVKKGSVVGEQTASTANSSTIISANGGSSNRSVNTTNTFEDEYLVGNAERLGGGRGPHLPFYAARPDGAREGDESSPPLPPTKAGASGESRLPPPASAQQWAQRKHHSMSSIGGPPSDRDANNSGGDAEHNHLGTEAPRPRLLVNIALNEDLTCSYRHSKISSCSVEGVVQVQVKSDSPVGVPFSLILRDPSRHIRTIHENKKYADDVTRQLPQPDDDDGSTERRFTVCLPKADNYFPIARYKCTSDLRPVPIRVQTRVRMHGIYCRVALQISSNPANEDDLTDLTIMMAVPDEVKGETLTTSPPGGVWTASKRSVLWCVAELGEGEKFQLQAQFEMETQQEQAGGAEREKPSFPVLVRCQCMYSQLSDVELEVCDRPDVFPAEITMKLARRFRLSHREKS